VTNTSIPILIPAREPKSSNGLVLLPEGPVYVRVLQIEELTEENQLRTFEKQFGAIPDSSRTNLLALLRLAQTTKSGDFKHLRPYSRLQAAARIQRELNLLKSIADTLKGDARKITKTKLVKPFVANRRRYLEQEESLILKRFESGHPLSAIAELALEINRSLLKARLVLWWPKSKGVLTLGLYCPEAESGLAALVFASLPNPQGLGICQRCSRQFLRKKRGQRFCSLRCGNADRKARERERRGRA
jgi:hypothetical protein